MTHYAKPSHIPYDEWFDQNIDPYDLKHINRTEKIFNNSVHEQFYKISKENLIIGGSEVPEQLNTLQNCKEQFCHISDEELFIL